ncbi:multivesicular body subunit 12B [Chironomus tepperi]|uniref:multivesicular body subunit 12B n=1 Tax=Chironomus tepperi TaxID=113505 RepID=UPI00391F9036
MSRNKIISSTQSSINPIESLLNILPCDRPIKSIQLIENVNECPSNYIPIHKTLDQDSDADLFKENLLFGKKNTRYLCISKTEGFDNFVVEKIKIINSSDNLANEGFISIKNTTDTNQKAWRKKQLVYKLGKTDNVKEYITDIVVLTKYKNPPEGFVYLGELEKMHVCFKLTSAKKSEIIDFTQQIENLRIQSNLYPNMTNSNNNTEHYYESLKLSYQLPASPPNRPTPLRAAPLPPTSPLNIDVSHNVSSSSNSNTGTLSHYHNDFIGIPFILNSRLAKIDCSFELPKSVPKSSSSIEYDFNLERQILCSTKNEKRKSSSTNPFF